jgi:hypothetical protein
VVHLEPEGESTGLKLHSTLVTADFFYVSAGQNRDQFPLEKSFSLSLSNIFHYFVSQFFLEPTKRQRFVLESTDIRL